MWKEEKTKTQWLKDAKDIAEVGKMGKNKGEDIPLTL